MSERNQILLTAAKGFTDLAGSIEKFATTIKSQAEACDHDRLFSCGCEMLGVCDMMRDWGQGLENEVKEVGNENLNT